MPRNGWPCRDRGTYQQVDGKVNVNMGSQAMDESTPDQERKTAFEQAGEEERISLLSEFVYFLRDNKKWWLTPIFLVMALVGALAMLSGSGAAPFIYTMF